MRGGKRMSWRESAFKEKRAAKLTITFLHSNFNTYQSFLIKLTFSSMRSDTLPEGLEDGIERFDTVGRGGFGQSGDGQRGDGTDFLLLVDQPVLDDFDEGAEMRQDGATHQNGDLLDDLDARVTRLPGLLRLTDGLEKGQK